MPGKDGLVPGRMGEILLTTSATAGEPQRLFEAALGAFVGRSQQYTVTPDGQKFILVEDTDGDGAAMPTIQVTQNWFPEFKGRQRE